MLHASRGALPLHSPVVVSYLDDPDAVPVDLTYVMQDDVALARTLSGQLDTMDQLCEVARTHLRTVRHVLRCVPCECFVRLVWAFCACV